MERQLLIAQLAVLLEQGAAQHALRRQAVAAGLLDPVPAQVRRDQAGQLTVVIEPRRHRPQLTADLVSGKQIEYAGLDRAFLAHCRLRRWGLCFGISGLTPSLPEAAGDRPRKNADFHNYLSMLRFMDGH
jgi:hypothetical protein